VRFIQIKVAERASTREQSKGERERERDYSLKRQKDNGSATLYMVKQFVYLRKNKKEEDGGFVKKKGVDATVLSMVRVRARACVYVDTFTAKNGATPSTRCR